MHLNLHGLIRSHDLELGRDSDTGGQTLYVLELVKGLASRPEIEKVDLVTRLIQDRRVSRDYAQSKEFIAPGAQILRFPFGPKRYIRKELLWPYLDDLADLLVNHLSQQNDLPDWIHAHYADAGYVGALISRRLGIPLVFTGHSLGREKQRRMLAAGVDHKQIEQSFSISRRIEAEEIALAHSNLVVTSTLQEAQQQYSRYGQYTTNLLQVIPPGVDAKRFHPLKDFDEDNVVGNLMNPFLRDSSLSPLLTISRAVQRKNIPTLVEAFGRSSVLRQRHNLILVLGCRDDSRDLEKQQRDIFQQIFELVDRYDLYGKIAYPKQHRRDQIPAIYRWASARKGLFVNPALTEPFGLTLLEAAACGLPVVTTDDGGPRDILKRCQNGLSVDVTDLEAFQDVLEQASSKQKQWKTWRDNGIEGITRHFSWDAHVCNYIACMQKRLKNIPPQQVLFETSLTKRQLSCKRLLLLDLDGNLENSDDTTLATLRAGLKQSDGAEACQLGVLTGRSIKAARYRFAELHLPNPVVWICRAGTEIYYNDDEAFDPLWEKKISDGWDREMVKNELSDFDDHFILQSKDQQGPYKISYLLNSSNKSILSLVKNRLRKSGCLATPHLQSHYYLDLVPLCASRVEAIRYLSLRWGLPLENLFVVASQQGDDELINGLTTTLIPDNFDSSLEKFRNHKRVCFSHSLNSDSLISSNHYQYFFNH